MSEIRHVHFIAIGGTGMGSLAGLLGARGLEITGSDQALYPPMSTALEGWGIEVDEGFRAENIRSRRPDLVVIGNAVRPDNPEAVEVIVMEAIIEVTEDAPLPLGQLALRGASALVRQEQVAAVPVVEMHAPARWRWGG